MSSNRRDRTVAPLAAALRLGGRALLVLAAALLVARSAPALPSGSQAAAESLELCEGADTLADDERAAALARGMALAEAALAADPGDALAHFATVCNLGKQMEAAGLGLGQLLSLRRLRRELDATLELAPADADALAAKGALLLRLPRWFGGDAAQAEELLRRALVSEPDNGTARCYLGQALSERGADDEARALLSHC
jgi:cytochrome c-type biogenesis protein CcmH/NrfG